MKYDSPEDREVIERIIEAVLGEVCQNKYDDTQLAIEWKTEAQDPLRKEMWLGDICLSWYDDESYAVEKWMMLPSFDRLTQPDYIVQSEAYSGNNMEHALQIFCREVVDAWVDEAFLQAWMDRIVIDTEEANPE